MSVSEFYDFESKFYDILYSSFIDDVLFIKKYGFRSPYCEFFSGTGRVSSLLDNSCGLEININMIKNSERRYNAIQGDVRCAPLKKAFNSVLIPLNSLNLMNRDDRVTTLKEAKRILFDEGKIYIEIMNGIPFRKDEEFLISEGISENYPIKAYLQLTEENGKYFFIYRYEIKKRDFIKKLRIYPITFDDFLDEIKSAELNLENIYGGYNFEEFNKYSDRIIAILTK